ncbi:MAG TPA: ankyrin repeat domain-containing protein, partial [Acidobacteriota bacterium]|nr:ankyrin repeat domain-containing protein [Acidobacteriota bacterium]
MRISVPFLTIAVCGVFILAPDSFADKSASKQTSGQLTAAVKENNLTKIENLLQNGVNVNERDASNNTPLMLAASSGFTGAMKVLLDSGAFVTARNIEGKTALMWAASSNQLEAIKLLMTSGAEVDDRNNSDETALMMAAG